MTAVTCPKCGKPALVWNDQPLCRDFQCWPCKPANPEFCRRNPDKVLASELTYFGNVILGALGKQSMFVSHVLALHDQESNAGDVISHMLTVVADIFWMEMSNQYLPDTPIAEKKNHFMAMWIASGKAAIERATQRPANVTLN